MIAQAAATAAALMPGRFFLGVGTGENLNEHVLGDQLAGGGRAARDAGGGDRGDPPALAGRLPEPPWRPLHRRAGRLYTLPEEPPPIVVAAGDPRAAELAGARRRRPDRHLARTGSCSTQFAAAGGKAKPRYGQVTVCWAEDEASARKTAHEWWPNAALPGELSQELALPRHFEQARGAGHARTTSPRRSSAGPIPKRTSPRSRRTRRRAYDHVYVHQVGPDQEGFLDFYSREILG